MEPLMQPISKSSVLEGVGESLVPGPVEITPTGGAIVQEQEVAVRSAVLEEVGEGFMAVPLPSPPTGDAMVVEQPPQVESVDA